MKITALVDNQSNSELKAKHGLCLYIQTKKHTILFDVGNDNTLFENAKMRGIDISQVDIVIISHGHIDHGGALSKFLEINSRAKIYIQRQAFQPHYNKLLFLKINIGINQKLENHSQINLIDGDYQIDEELRLFTVKSTEKCYSPMNDSLYEKNKKDEFSHEQNLIIQENQTALIMGCGHTGIVNILNKAEGYVELCVGGYHLFNPITRKTASIKLLDHIIKELEKYKDIQFYTCHCTGMKAFTYLSQQMNNLSYLSCGQTIDNK